MEYRGFVFTPEERAELRDMLISMAHDDPRVTGCALTGSGSLRREDRWSDIDLALGIAPDADIGSVIADFTEVMYRNMAVHHTDVISGATTYRVYLLASSLQVDIAFAPAYEFGPTAPTFSLVFGEAVDRPWISPPAAAGLIGLGWLYALHARSSIARRRVWQAEYMISGVRDQVLALACLRYGVSAYQGRGMDQLPADITGELSAALVRSLDPQELSRAFRAAIQALLNEIACFDEHLSMRLSGLLSELAAVQD